ncbi:MAG: ABC transporter ATP-binding protein [Verrucomicrobiota bacterium]
MRVSRFCLSVFRANPWPICLFFLANIIAFTIAPIVLGHQMQWFFDAIMGESPELRTAFFLVIWMIVLAAARMMFMLARTVFYQAAAYVVSTMLRRNVFENILRRRGVRSLRSSTGDIISRLRDDVDAFTWFVHTVGYYGSFFLFCLCGLAIMWTIDETVTWVVALPIVLISALVTIIKPRIQALTSSERDSTTKVTGFIGSIFSNVESIKAACAEQGVVDEFRKHNKARGAATVRYDVFGAFVGFLGEAIYIVGISVFLLMVGDRMRAGEFSVGNFALFTHFISYLGTGMDGLAKILTDYKGMDVHLSRLESMLSDARNRELVTPFSAGFTCESVRKKKTPLELSAGGDLRSVTVKGLEYVHPVSGDGIFEVDLEVRVGECLVIAGEVGSGKSTLVRCILGHLPIDVGNVFWNDEKIDSPAQFLVPQRCAYVPQHPKLFSDTLEANVFQGRHIDESRRNEILEQAVLLNEMDRLAQGWRTQVGPSGVKLSGGQVQRVALARMFASRSSLMVADDPVRGLDASTETKFWEGLQTGSGGAFLFVSNSRMALKRADRIYVMKGGRMIGEGALDELLANCSEMNRIWKDNF